MTKSKVILICDKFEKDGINLLKKSGFKIIEKPLISTSDLLRYINKINVIVVRSRTKITRDIIEKSNTLELIARPGTGVDNIDLIAAKDNDIPVFTSVEASTNSVAELAIAFAISLSRSIPQADSKMKQGVWSKDTLMGNELKDKHFGIVGMGRIGRRTAQLAHALEMNVLAYEKLKIENSFCKKHNVKQVTLKQLLKKSDFVSLHLPFTKETNNIIGKKELELMKHSAYIINTARGQLISEKDLYVHLKNSRIAGAALDVFSVEPPKNKNTIRLSNVIATPHIGAQIIEAQKEASLVIAQKIIKHFSKL